MDQHGDDATRQEPEEEVLMQIALQAERKLGPRRVEGEAPERVNNFLRTICMRSPLSLACRALLPTTSPP